MARKVKGVPVLGGEDGAFKDKVFLLTVNWDGVTATVSQ